MDKNELILEFIRMETLDNKTAFHVGTITWDGHSPSMEWTSCSEIDGTLTDIKKEEEIDKILSNTKFFRYCKECSQLNPVGWMHDKRTCQNCAEKNHGIVH